MDQLSFPSKEVKKEILRTEPSLVSMKPNFQSKLFRFSDFDPSNRLTLKCAVYTVKKEEKAVTEKDIKVSLKE